MNKVHNNRPNIAHLLLAAGGSTRMGRPKQLLPWKGGSLIRHAINNILKAKVADKVVVILGAYPTLIAPELEGLEVEVIVNQDWAEGMGSTIRYGLQYLLEKEGEAWTGVSISLVDQPLVTARHFQMLFEQWQQSELPVAAAHYQQVLGVPAIFDRSFFPKLRTLEGPPGARKILMQIQDQVLPVALPEAQFDVDTPEDYQKLKSSL